MTGTDLEEFAAFAGQLADASRAQLRASLCQPVQADPTGDGSPVTAIDRAVEVQLREMITARYPDHGIVGEEHGAAAPEREWVWVLDPIDGTLPFLAGLPVFGTLIALLRGGAPLVGVYTTQSLPLPLNGNNFQYDPSELFKDWIQKGGKAQAEFMKNFACALPPCWIQSLNITEGSYWKLLPLIGNGRNRVVYKGIVWSIFP